MPGYRAGVVGLGWTGMLYDLAERVGDRDSAYSVDDVDRPMPAVDVHRRLRYHEHPGRQHVPTSYAEAFWDRPETELVAAADRDTKRLELFRQRYDIDSLYTDTAEMLRKERLDIVAIATNVKGRADLTCLAVETGARAVMTEKPMAHTLDEADRMVKTCSDAGVPLCCGNVPTTHPSFAVARELVKSGAIGEVVSIEAMAPVGPRAQDQNWSYFLDSPPAWGIGVGDEPRRESGSDEFAGQGMLVCADGTAVHFRKGAPRLRMTGTAGEMQFTFRPSAWRLWQDIDTPAGIHRVEVPWPGPQMMEPYGAVYALADVLDCLEGKLDEPKNSGRVVATALEVEIALKLSSAGGGTRVDLPLADRSLALNYDWFR